MRRGIDSIRQRPPARPSAASNGGVTDPYKDTGESVSGGKRAFCNRCQRATETVYLPLSSGHIANACAICRTCRRLRPYVTRREYEQHLQADGRRKVETRECCTT